MDSRNGGARHGLGEVGVIVGPVAIRIAAGLALKEMPAVEAALMPVLGDQMNPVDFPCGLQCFFRRKC